MHRRCGPSVQRRRCVCRHVAVPSCPQAAPRARELQARTVCSLITSQATAVGPVATRGPRAAHRPDLPASGQSDGPPPNSNVPHRQPSPPLTLQRASPGSGKRPRLLKMSPESTRDPGRTGLQGRPFGRALACGDACEHVCMRVSGWGGRAGVERKKEQAHFPEHAVTAACALGARQGPGVPGSPETPPTPTAWCGNPAPGGAGRHSVSAPSLL